MEEENQLSEIETRISFPEIAPAEKSEIESFWKQLRHFYRSGEKKSIDENSKLKSIFINILDRDNSQYPFALGKNDVQNIPFTKNAPFEILQYLLSEHRKGINQHFASKLQALFEGLKKQLKLDVNLEADSMKETYGFASTMMAFDKMAELVSKKMAKGSNLDEERAIRLKDVLSALTDAINYFNEAPASILIDRSTSQTYNLKGVFKNLEIVDIDPNNPFAEAQKIFSEKMGLFTDLIKAYRIALLDLEGKYQKEVHDDYFTHFTWHRLFDNELSLFHPMVLIVDYQSAVDNLNALSKLFASSQCINILVINDEVVSRSNKETSWEDAAHQFRQELAAFAMSHRNIYTFQAAIDNPNFMYQGFDGLLKSNRPSIAHILLSEPGDEDYFRIKATSQSRYFPRMVFNPLEKRGESHTLDISENYQSNKSWPLYSLGIKKGDKEEKLELDFTYADYKALYPSKLKELFLIPPEFYTENLIPLSHYLQLEEEKLYGKIPFIWLVDEKNVLQKAAVPNLWMVSCQERLDNWNYLQNLARPTANLTQNIVDAKENDKVIPEKHLEIEDQSKINLEEIQEKAIRIAAERMLQGLLGIERESDAVLKNTAVKLLDEEPLTSESKDDAKNQAETPKPQPKHVKAFVESENCTSCNECVDQYPDLFKYNEDKLAYLQNPEKGSFEQLVKAAEKCPAACIHPGLPTNPKEANLEKLIKRAEKFN